MESKRNIAEIGRKTGQSEQNMQHFMSNSPWSGKALINALQDAIGYHPAFADSVLVIDESADEKKGEQSAGAGRQRNGRLGKVDVCQVGVFATLATPQAHCWVDGELYIPKNWFEEENKKKRQKAGIPDKRIFQTKIELAEKLILRCRDEGLLPFVAVDMDSLYGRSFALRQKLQQEGIEYYADIPENTVVYLERPQVSRLKKNGEPAKTPTVIGKCCAVRYLLDHAGAESEYLRLRPSERGYIEDRFIRLPVWTEKDGILLREWLLIRQSGKQITYVLSNATEDTSLETMAKRKTCRYFVERDNQDCKSEFGWDEFQATKYLAWEHQLALTVMASWFVTQTRLEWTENHPKDENLLDEYQTDALPSLSVANIRELLRAAMPLPQLNTQQATALVVKHLKNRTQSRASRLRKSALRTTM